MESSEKFDRDEIHDLMDKLNTAIKNKDIDSFMACYVSDDSLLSIGTTIDEIFTDLESNYRGWKIMFDQLEDLKFQREINIYHLEISGDFAWYAKEISWIFTPSNPKEQKLKNEFRATGVLRKTTNGWRFQQRHISAAKSGVEKGRRRQTTKGMETQISKWIKDFELNPNLIESLRQSELLNYLLKAQTILSSA